MTSCTDQVVSLSLDTTVPHMRQEITLPLSAVEVSRTFPTIRAIRSVPLKRERMMLIAQGKTPGGRVLT